MAPRASVGNLLQHVRSEREGYSRVATGGDTTQTWNKKKQFDNQLRTKVRPAHPKDKKEGGDANRADQSEKGSVNAQTERRSVRDSNMVR